MRKIRMGRRRLLEKGIKKSLERLHNGKRESSLG
jgi:hypothetical protein